MPKVLLGALSLSFFGALMIAAGVYPAGYDWRYTVMSSLASPTENPGAYRIAADGMMISGVLLSILGVYIRRSLRPYAPRWTVWARTFFVSGGVLLTISALITPGNHDVFHFPRAHAKMAQAAGVGFVVGMILNLPAILRNPLSSHRWVRAWILVLMCVPLISFLLSWIVIPMAEIGVSASLQHEIHESILESLAFWEWVGSVCVFLFVALITLTYRCDPSLAVPESPGN